MGQGEKSGGGIAMAFFVLGAGWIFCVRNQDSMPSGQHLQKAK